MTAREEKAEQVADAALNWIGKFFGGQAWVNIHVQPPKPDGGFQISVNLNAQSPRPRTRATRQEPGDDGV